MRAFLPLLLSLMMPLFAQAAPTLLPGDILLQPLQCWSCSLIEEEENSIFSHVGVVVSIHPTVQVAEALGKVRALPLQAFVDRTEAGQSIRVLRLRSPRPLGLLQRASERLINTFQAEFEGLDYDHSFLWDNQGSNGSELLYCSELVAKLLDRAWGVQIPLKRMHFDKNPDLWRRFFKGPPPAGEWGLSPGDFERSELFDTVGDLSSR